MLNPESYLYLLFTYLLQSPSKYGCQIKNERGNCFHSCKGVLKNFGRLYDYCGGAVGSIYQFLQKVVSVKFQLRI